MFQSDQFLEAVYTANKDDKARLEKMIKRIDPNEPMRYGYMALHIVSDLGYEGAVETLLNHNVDITAKTENRVQDLRKNALRIAVEKLHPKIVELLLKKGAPTNPSDNETSSILDWAKKKKQDPNLSDDAKINIAKICELLEKPPLAEGPSGEYHLTHDPAERHEGSGGLASMSKKWKELKDPDLPPNPYASQACKTYRITVVDFFVQDQVIPEPVIPEPVDPGPVDPGPVVPEPVDPGPAVPEPVDKRGDASQCKEYRNFKSYSVHDVLYDHKIPESLSDKEARMQSLDKIRSQFTWYHVPANNVSPLSCQGICLLTA